MSVVKTRPLFLSDGTPVTFVKTTSKGNIQVRVPASHPLGATDPLRIFKPSTGEHYKGQTDLKLTNTSRAVNRSRPMFLSDGTPVSFVKVTSKGNIQVRVPTSHPLGAADPLRIFVPSTGAHYKGRADGLFLTNVAPAQAAAASGDSVTYSVTVGGRTVTRKTYEGAESYAISMLSPSLRSINIDAVRTTKSVAGTVSLNAARAS